MASRPVRGLPHVWVLLVNAFACSDALQCIDNPALAGVRVVASVVSLSTSKLHGIVVYVCVCASCPFMGCRHVQVLEHAPV